MWTNWGYFKKLYYSNGKLYVILIFKKYSYNCGKYHCEIPKKCYFLAFCENIERSHILHDEKR